VNTIQRRIPMRIPEYSREFTKIDEAKEEKENIDKDTFWYCPGSLTTCKNRCWCYQESQIEESGKDKWKVKYPYCTNPLYNREG
jgi:hypothetical protein